MLDELIEEPDSQDKRANFIEFINQKDQINVLAFKRAQNVWQYLNAGQGISKVKQAIRNKKKFSEEYLQVLRYMKNALELNFQLVQQKRLLAGELVILAKEYICIIKKKLDTKLPSDVNCLAELLLKIAEYICQRLSKYPENHPLPWDISGLYLVLDGYGQFIELTEIPELEFPSLEEFYAFYIQLTGSKIKPIFLYADEENIMVDTTNFPEDVLLKILSLKGINHTPFEYCYIINAFGKKLAHTPHLLSLFAHELGHILDKNYLQLEQAVMQELMANYYQYFQEDTSSLNWLNELIADAIGVCMMGPAYLYAQMSFFKEESMMYPSKPYPGIAYRTKIIYNYLLQNEYLELFSPANRQKIEAKLIFYQQQYTAREDYHRILEDIFSNYIAFIYQTLIDFFNNQDLYLTYSEIDHYLSDNKGSVTSALTALDEKSLSLKEYILRQNLLMLSEIDNYEFHQQ